MKLISAILFIYLCIAILGEPSWAVAWSCLLMIAAFWAVDKL